MEDPDPEEVGVANCGPESSSFRFAWGVLLGVLGTMPLREERGGRLGEAVFWPSSIVGVISMEFWVLL